MKLKQFLANPGNRHSSDGNPSVKCNSLSKTRKALNCQLTPAQAIEVARHILAKAQIILDHTIEDGAVQIWNAGINSETISFGLAAVRKGGRRKVKLNEK